MLSQAEATVAGGQDLTDADAATFSAWWQRFTAIWPAFLQLRDEIQDHANRWAALAEAAYAEGDVEGYRALTANAERLRQLEQDRSQVETTVARFKSGWDSLQTYIGNLGRWFGLQGNGLGLAPLVLLVGIPTLIGALAWVVQKYFEIRNGLDYDMELLRSAEGGRLTPGQIEALKRPTEAAAGATWPMALIVVGLGVLAFTMFGGKRP